MLLWGAKELNWLNGIWSKKEKRKIARICIVNMEKERKQQSEVRVRGEAMKKKNANQEENAKIDVLQWQIETKTEKHYDCRLHSFFYKTRTWKDPRTAIPKLLRFKRSGKLLLNGHATVTWAHNQESQLLHTHTANVVTILWRSMHTIKNNFQKVCTK